MIYVGIDDTDMPDTPGTNQLARALVQQVSNIYRCRSIVRHQLLDDPRVPYTSKNGSASIVLDAMDHGRPNLAELTAALRKRMLEWYVEGSDPGLCVTETVSPSVIKFGKKCQRELVARSEAEKLARSQGVFLEGLGGTCGGMIGALAAVGLVATGNDGRVVVNGAWPDDLSGPQRAGMISARNIVVRELSTGQTVSNGVIDVGKHLRPNLRNGQFVLFVERAAAEYDFEWRAVRLT